MKQTILTISLFLILAATGFVWYRAAPVEDESRPITGEAGVQLTELRRLKTLKLDTSVLRDPFFVSLQFPAEATGVEQGGVSAGRANPFLPF